MDEQNLITIEHNGEELVAEILFTHEDEETKKTFIVFQFLDSEEISAACYVETSETEGYFEDIETEEEWIMLDELLETYFDDSDEDV